MSIKPYSFADGIYYRLGKKLTKQETGIVLVSCKTLLGKFSEKGWQDFEVWAFVDNLIYQMQKNQIPRSFRMFYTLACGFLCSPIYTDNTVATDQRYAEWIQNEIERLKTT